MSPKLIKNDKITKDFVDLTEQSFINENPIINLTIGKKGFNYTREWVYKNQNLIKLHFG